MSTASAAVLEAVGEGRVALQGVEIDAVVRGLLSEVSVTQTYRNQENVNIEAVYTFPLPLDAVLLELRVELNGRVLEGAVKARREAEADYEQAIDDGNSAVLLQQRAPGLFAMNVGNLQAGETAKVHFRYAQLHRWQGDSLRFHLPTTIAPRYGDPAAAGLRPHEQPEYTLNADHGFSLSLRIEGALASAPVECPSHAIESEQQGGARSISLRGGSALMDRDFVLVLRQPENAHAEGLVARDGAGQVALASFHPHFPSELQPLPRCIKLVIDCSGSMAGDSIAQARAAVREILGNLHPSDHFNLCLFGTTAQLMSAQALVANEANIAEAMAFAAGIQADMGSTEIGGALAATYHSAHPADMPADVLLITDGEIWGDGPLIEAARQSRHRVFTVGVGSAVSEEFLRRLSAQTGGACELVSPREDMAERIVRHFRRIGQPMVSRASVDWSAQPACQVPGTIETVYGGDTLHVFAWFDQAAPEQASLVLGLNDGEEIRQPLRFSAIDAADGQLSDLARVAAHARLQTLEADAARDMAEQYQLLTEQTSMVLVYAREAGEQAQDLPQLRKVPQQWAAGSHGLGSVLPTDGVMMRAGGISADYLICDEYCEPVPQFSRSERRSELKARRRIQPDHEATTPFLGDVDWYFIETLNARYPDTASSIDIRTLHEFRQLLPHEEMLEELQDMVDDEASEQQVIAAFLLVLAEIDATDRLSRHLKRLIRKLFADVSPSERLLQTIREKIELDRGPLTVMRHALTTD